ncbi:small multi-drug export protein [Candidatus Woesearchaeota archaeon]|nr:small multi-drug export protein [Candidatus Woesearchaeota archaeon]
MDALIKAMIWSFLPISELRGGIPIGLYAGLNIFLVYFASVIANILVVPVVYFFLGYVHDHFMKSRLYKKTFDGFLDRTRRKAHKSIDKWGYIGLMIFVAIPFPATGAYTGALAAWFFELDKWKSFLAISLGVAIAGIIVTLIVSGGFTAFNFLVK